MPDDRKPRVIKRYANRKLYDMSESCYITHDEIANLVEAGEEVRVIDNRTKEDLTTKTLTQILFEKEKKTRRQLPLSTLRGLFQSGGTFIQKHITDPVTSLREEADKGLRKVFRARAEDETPPGQAPPPGEPEPVAAPQDEGAAAAASASASESVREWVDNSQRAVETLQKTLEERWTLVVNSLGHFDINHRRIAELERRVADLEAKLAQVTNTGGVP